MSRKVKNLFHMSVLRGGKKVEISWCLRLQRKQPLSSRLTCGSAVLHGETFSLVTSPCKANFLFVGEFPRGVLIYRQSRDRLKDYKKHAAMCFTGRCAARRGSSCRMVSIVVLLPLHLHMYCDAAQSVSEKKKDRSVA